LNREKKKRKKKRKPEPNSNGQRHTNGSVRDRQPNNPMQDNELKRLLLETCPVRPGQENRAWLHLREQLYGTPSPRSHWRWLYLPSWRGLVVAGVALALIPILGDFFVGGLQPVSFATADSQAPGIYATAFYSKSAQAQVVWLNGMEPATDRPTYLDPTTVVPRKASPAPRDPNSL
jgi:hypothetical protein